MPARRIDDLGDLTVQGIWWAHVEGGFVPADAEELAAVRAAAVLAQKGHRTWKFQAATDDLTSWEDTHGGYWIVDPNNGCIWEWGSV